MKYHRERSPTLAPPISSEVRAVQFEFRMSVNHRIAEDRRDADTLAVREGPFGFIAARDLCDIQNTHRPALLVLEDELDLGRWPLRDLRGARV